MAEENQQQELKEPQRVTTKDPKKVEAGKRLAAINRKKREAKKREEQAQLEKTHQSKPILRHQSCHSSGSDRWSWLLHLLVQENPRNHRSHDVSLPTTTPPGDSRARTDQQV